MAHGFGGTMEFLFRRAAIRFARVQPDLDSERIALWGSSFGGGHVIAVAAEDPAVAAVVAQVPWLGDGRAPGAKLRHLFRWNSLKLTVAALRDARRARRGAAPLLGVREHPVAQRVRPSGRARPGALRAGKLADRLTMPVLVCAAEEDAEIPLGYIRSALARAPRAELRTYPGNHFEIYYGAVYEQVVADQTDFLRTHLAVASRSGR